MQFKLVVKIAWDIIKDSPTGALWWPVSLSWGTWDLRMTELGTFLEKLGFFCFLSSRFENISIYLELEVSLLLTNLLFSSCDWKGLKKKENRILLFGWYFFTNWGRGSFNFSIEYFYYLQRRENDHLKADRSIVLTLPRLCVINLVDYKGFP